MDTLDSGGRRRRPEGSSRASMSRGLVCKNQSVQGLLCKFPWMVFLRGFALALFFWRRLFDDDGCDVRRVKAAEATVCLLE